MPKNQTLDEFYSTFREEVLCASDTETSGWTTEDFLTNVMMEYLEEAGEVTDPVICPFRGYGLQMNAYAISEDCESVDIFVSIYSESDRPRSVSQADIDAAIKRAIQLYHKAINDLYTAFQKDNDTYEFAITLHQNKDNIKHVRICALTNGLVKPIALKNITIGDAEISFSLWDVDRLYRCVTSGKMRETIEIDFEEKFQTSIPCIENNTSKKYSVYLAIINGDLLAALYDEFRDRLLEKNVRSFLQVKEGLTKESGILCGMNPICSSHITMAFLSLPRVSKSFGTKTVNLLLNAFGICRLLTEAKLLLLFSTLRMTVKLQQICPKFLSR